ncbi:unnamed protein product [Rotaria magnacalcarata]|uniref:Uncharacterized protein n=2 Tax=Rotaria magnacalcarata TaxID=392030 RepID=A0A816SE82_9BILA|nr:unnamed protein product [Rotaria magnacalcarata]
MVHNAIGSITETVHQSLEKSYKKLSSPQQFTNISLQNKTSIKPLMAQPYEVINITNGNGGGTQVIIKPPDKPNEECSIQYQNLGSFNSYLFYNNNIVVVMLLFQTNQACRQLHIIYVYAFIIKTNYQKEQMHFVRQFSFFL